MPTSPPAGWYSDPNGSAGQRYWDAQHWTTQRRPEPAAARSGLAAWDAAARRRWVRFPAALRVAIPVALAAALLGLGIVVWTESPRGDWVGFPRQLTCRLQDGPRPPDKITVSSVATAHPRSSVLELTVRFAQPLPQSPSGSRATGFAGYVLTYRVANGDKAFVELSPEEDTDDLAVTSTLAASGDESRMRPDRDTNARRTSPDTVQIVLDLKRLGADNQPVRPQLTIDAQFNTPSTTTVRFAAQVCG